MKSTTNRSPIDTLHARCKWGSTLSDHMYWTSNRMLYTLYNTHLNCHNRKVPIPTRATAQNMINGYEGLCIQMSRIKKSKGKKYTLRDLADIGGNEDGSESEY